MTLIIPFTIILLMAFGLSCLLKLKPLEGIFIGVSTLIILMIIITTISTLTIAAYAITGLYIATFAAGLVYSVLKKNFLKQAKEFITNPALIAFILAVGIYSVLVYDNHLISWDDFSHWGLAVKVFLAYDGFAIPSHSLASQTNALPLFNSFISKTAGFQEGYLLCGMWFVYWTCLLLPASGLKWDNWKEIAIYSFLVYSALMFISHPVRPNLYNDAMLSVVPGSVVAYYFVNKNKAPANIVRLILIAGLLFIPHIKRVVGLVFALFVAALYLYGLYEKYENKKKFLLQNFYLLLIPFISLLLDKMSKAKTFKQFVNVRSFTTKSWCDPIGSITNVIKSPLGMLLIALILILGALSIVSLIKKLKFKKIALIFLSFSVLAFVGYTFINLDSGTIQLINAYIKNILKLNVDSLRLYKVISILFVFLAAIYSIGIKDVLRKKYRHISLIFIVEGILYCILLLGAYTKFSEYEAMKSASLNRYISSFLYYIIFAFAGVFILRDSIFKRRELKVALLSILSVFTITQITPTPLTVYNYEVSTSSYENSEQYAAYCNALQINNFAEKGDKIYLIAQENDGYKKLLMQYFCVDKYITGSYSLGPEKYEGDIWSKDYSIDKWKEILIAQEFQYLFIYTLDDYFLETYNSMFEDESVIYAGRLYEIVIDGDDVKFELIG